MSGSPSKRPRPSYEEGEARDPEVRKMLEESVEDEDGLLALIKRSVTKPHRKAS